MSKLFEEITMIAETAQSYEGSIDLALASFDAAARAEADLVNIQVVYAGELSTPDFQYHALYEQLELPLEDWKRIFAHAKKAGIKTIASVFGPKTAQALADLNVHAYKVHAADTANRPFLEALAEIGKPVMVATGGSTLGEIHQALDILRKRKDIDVALLPGIQNTPTKPEESHLTRIRFLKERFQVPVGYADHIDGEDPLAISFPGAAIAAGADFVEKHLTLVRALQREDFTSSLNPDEYKLSARIARQVKKSRGVPGVDIGAGEEAYREGMKKRVVAREDLKPGQILDYADIDLLRSSVASDLWNLESAVGRTLVKPVKKNAPIQDADLTKRPAKLKKVVAVLNVRNESTRLWAKPLQLVGKKTILEHLIDQVRLAKRVDQIVLGISENPENRMYEDFARKRGIPYVFGSDPDALKRMIQAADFVGADSVLRITTENPYVYWEGLDELIEAHLREGADFSIIENLPEGAYAEVIEVSALKKSHKEGQAKHRSELITSFINQNPDQFKIIKVTPPEELRRPEIRLTVDWPEDLIVVRKIYDAHEGKTPIHLKSIIDYLDANPEVKDINGKIEAGAGRIWH